MKLSTRGKYGLLAMYDLASHMGAPIAVKTIAERQGISNAYLEQLFASLRKAGLVESRRGAQGGYELKRPPEEITIGEILVALEGSVAVTDCVESTKCGMTCSCPSRAVYTKIQASIDTVLDDMKLSDMLQGSLA